MTAPSLVDADLFRAPAAPEEGRHHADLSATPLVYHDGHYAHPQGVQ